MELEERQRYYNSERSIESLANSLLSSGVSGSPFFTAGLFQRHLPNQTNEVNNTSRIPTSSLLSHLSAVASSQRTSGILTNPEPKTPRMEDTPSHPSRERTSSASHTESTQDAKSLARRKRNSSDTTSNNGIAGLAEGPTTKRKKRSYHHEPFPMKLYRLLRETESAGESDIISFTEDGRQFCVHKPIELETNILPKYFRHNQLSSFRRLLNMYGFTRLQDGAEGGTFRHPSFIKGKPELCKDISRVR